MDNPLERLPSRWKARVRAWGKPLAAGGLFTIGSLVLVRALGPRVARSVGEAGGEGFAQGVARAQDALSRFSGAAGRGARFG